MAENQEGQKFYRILLDGFSNQLAIPQRLTKFFIKENMRSVTLLSPLGESWNVGIRGHSKRMHFAEGWDRFATAHRLSFGELLVFKYVGGMAFHVTVFDKSTCEKDRMIANGVAGVESVDHVLGQGKNCDQVSASFKEKTTAASSGRRTPPVLIDQESSEDQTQVSVRRAAQKLVHKTKKACKRGSCFMITISAKLRYTVRIPTKFARSNDLSNFHQMLLRDPEGHLWHVNLLHGKHPVSGHEWLLLSGGWRDFCHGNDLNDGDVCVFELEKKNELLVQIHRSCRDGSKRSSRSMQQAVHLKEATTSLHQKQESPWKVTSTSKPAILAQFKSTIFPTSLRKGCNMHIPKTFLSSVDLSAAEKEAILVDSHSRRWPVEIYHNKKWRRCRMGNGGWGAFCDENDVEVGDVCVFSFHRRGNEATFDVEVIKSKKKKKKTI